MCAGEKKRRFFRETRVCERKDFHLIKYFLICKKMRDVLPKMSTLSNKNTHIRDTTSKILKLKFYTC